MVNLWHLKSGIQLRNVGWSSCSKSHLLDSGDMYVCMYVCMFIHNRHSGPWKVLYSTILRHSSTSPDTMTQSCVAHRSQVPPGLPDHLSTRGAASRHVHTPRTSFTATLRPQNKRHTIHDNQCYWVVSLQSWHVAIGSEASMSNEWAGLPVLKRKWNGAASRRQYIIHM